jgi:hypothetical protein
MKLQLLYFEGCPNIELARSSAKSVLCDFPMADFEELDVTDASTPDALRGWGSPTLLVNGQCVTGAEPTGSCCRLYDEHHPESRGVPSADVIRRALEAARG